MGCERRHLLSEEKWIFQYSKYNLHSNKLEIFKHHVKSLLLMFEYEHLHVKEYNRRVGCFFFVQATNESNGKTRVKLLVQRNQFAI